MAVTLPYPTINDVGEFTPLTVHSDIVHNLPHSHLLANDQALKTAVDSLETTFISSSFDWTQHLLSNNGYQRFPEGLILQWARGNSMPTAGVNQAIAWPTLFTACYVAIVSTYMTPPGTTGYKQWFTVQSFSVSSVTVRLNREETQASGPMTPFVVGIGYKA